MIHNVSYCTLHVFVTLCVSLPPFLSLFIYLSLSSGPDLQLDDDDDDYNSAGGGRRRQRGRPDSDG